MYNEYHIHSFERLIIRPHNNIPAGKGAESMWKTAIFSTRYLPQSRTVCKMKNLIVEAPWIIHFHHNSCRLPLEIELFHFYTRRNNVSNASSAVHAHRLVWHMCSAATDLFLFYRRIFHSPYEQLEFVFYYMLNKSK